MSVLGSLFRPIFQAVSAVLAFYYNAVPNYAVAIALLTITVMAVMIPLTVTSTRSTVAMQRLNPEVAKLRAKYKTDKVRAQEEIMALYKENKVNPAGGCLPMVLQFPIFIVLYEVVRGLTATTRTGHVVRPSPKYISHSTLLYHHLIQGGGQMVAFGVDLARSATSVHGGFLHALPYYLLIAIAVALQYLQMRQLMSRNSQMPQSAINQQTQQIQKYTPIAFGALYITFPAAVTVYFVVSSLFRIVQQLLMYKYDPMLRRIAPAGGPKTSGSPSVEKAAGKSDGATRDQGQASPRGATSPQKSSTGKKPGPGKSPEAGGSNRSSRGTQPARSRGDRSQAYGANGSRPPANGAGPAQRRARRPR